MKQIDVSNTSIELIQLASIAEKPRFDGSILCKVTRDKLYYYGFIHRLNGFNFISEEGFKLLYELGYIKA